MKTKFFTLNKNNKVEFTEKELRRLLDEIYNDGYSDGRNSRGWWYTTPVRYTYTSPWYTTTSATSNSSSDNPYTISGSSLCVNGGEYSTTSTTHSCGENLSCNNNNHTVCPKDCNKEQEDKKVVFKWGK